MAKKKGVLIGLGCLALVVLGAIVGLFAVAAAQSRLPGDIVLAVNLNGPIVEIATEDPFAEITGAAPLAMRDLRKALVRAADDDRVRGVRLRVDGFGGGFANAQEVRTLIGRVRAAGKWTSAYLDTAGEFSPGNMVYYVASACDEISINPAGDVNLIGLSARSPFVRGTFDKLGIKPEFPGRGPYKTARFMYTEKDFTPSAREMMGWLLGSVMDQLVADIAANRGMDAAALRNLIDSCPLSAAKAADAGLVDHLEDWTAFRDRTRNKDAGEATVVGLHHYVSRIKAPMTSNKIAVVTAIGGIMRGESGKSMNPLLGGEVMGSETIAKAWRDVRKAKGIKAAVFRIDSPGGSAIASEIIRQEMARVAETMPVVVSMSNVAGSGGYWITCGAKYIVADPGTITASIGVFGGHLNMQKFWSDKLGVTFGKMDLGANANMYGDLDDWTDPQRAIVDAQLDRIYSDFLERVADSRGMTTDEVHAMAEGRVFTGTQALEKGLIDEVGDFDAALAAAKRLAGIDAGAAVSLVDYPKTLPWWQQILQKRKNEEAAVAELRQIVERSITTGQIDVPGVAWMPPIVIE